MPPERACLGASVLRRGGQVLFWAWVPFALLAGASLLAGHWRTLPTPAADDARLVTGLAELRSAEDGDRWMAVHVLYAACKCSRRVVEHLVDDPRPAWIVDKVLLVGSEEAVDAKLAAGRMTVVRVTPEQLANEFAVEGAPMFAVVDDRGVIRYRGGYTERKQGLAIQDVAILERLRADDVVPTLPLFGCAVSRRLQALLDPLGLRDQSSPAPGESTP
jgi:hypothetical protein